MASEPPPPYAPPETDKAGYYPPGGYYPQNPGYPPGGAPGYPPGGAPGYPPGGAPGYPPGGAPPQHGFQVPYQPQPITAQPMAPLQQQSIIVVTQPAVGVGNCPICRNGFIVEDFTCCGICLAIFFFPLGIICCMLMRSRRCNRCGATV